MPILDVQKRVAVIGHIRLGEQVTEGNKTRPRALRGFRFTTGRRELAEAVAAAYGGRPTEWLNPTTGIPGYEILTEAAEIPVLIPPAELAFSQHYELWSGAGCERRCDGYTEARGPEPQPCLCAVDGVRVCDSVTRLSLLVPDIAAVFGVWQLVTHSYYASGELASAVELALGLAQRRGENLGAGTLRLEQRVARKPGEKPHRYTLPVLDIWLSPEALGGLAAPSRPALAPEPVDEAVAALTVVGLPEPAPRIDRGAPSPDPAPLTDEGFKAPAFNLPGLSPPGPYGEAVEPVQGTGAVTAETAPAPAPVVPMAEADKTRRYLFAQMREVWPRETKEQIDDRRACLAIMCTAKRRGMGEPSWKELTTAELYDIANRVKDIKGGRLLMEPIVGGYVFTSQSGRKLFIRKNEAGQYEHWTQEKGQ